MVCFRFNEVVDIGAICVQRVSAELLEYTSTGVLNVESELYQQGALSCEICKLIPDAARNTRVQTSRVSYTLPS